MSRRFIATILAAAIAVTGFTARPAQANDAEKIVKFLGTAATIYIIGNAIKEARADDDRKDKKVHDQRYYRENRRDHAQRWQRDRWDQRDQRHHGARRDSRGLPAQCLLTGVPRRGDSVQVFGARCVERNYRHARYLPAQCRAQMQTRERGVRTVYVARCLRRAGFDVARR